MAFADTLLVFRSRKILLLLLLGFSSGLPLALTAGTLQAWLTVDGVDLKTIMDICGFKSYQMVLRYIGTSTDERLKDAAKRRMGGRS